MGIWRKILSVVLAAAIAVSVPASGAVASPAAGGVNKAYDSVANPAWPKAQVRAKKLYTMGDSNFDTTITAGTLQGILAKKGSEENIYIMPSIGPPKWLEILEKNYGVESQPVLDVWAVLPKFASKLNGYILCKTTEGDVPQMNEFGVNVDESVNVANSLCAQLGAIAVTEMNESKAKAAGLKMVLDVRGWTEEELLEKPEYFDKLSRDIIVEQWQYKGSQLRDYAVLADAMVFYSPHLTEGLRYKFLEKMNPGFTLFGYGDPDQGEDRFIGEVSDYDGYEIPSDNTYNLSVLSAFDIDALKQKTKPVSTENNQKHTVTFMMTDGDNLQFATNDFISSKWFGSSTRGSHAMGWGMPASIIDLAPATAQWYYDNMTPNDGYIMQIGGLGYLYPQRLSPAMRKKHAEMVNSYMGRLDINILEVMGFDEFYETDLVTVNEVWNDFTRQPNIDGLFYIDYMNYSGYQGAIGWQNNKPVISSRFNMWTWDNGSGFAPGGTLKDLQGIFSKVGTADSTISTDPYLESGYSLIMVHCWSQTMREVARLVESFDDTKIQVVTPQEFMARVKAFKPNANGRNIKTGWQKDKDGDWLLYDDEGQVLHGWQIVDKKWYYLDPDTGVMQTGWKQIGGKWYFLESSGKMVTGWKQLGNKWYFFESGGAMATGWKKIGGKWYYLGSDGKMQTGWYKVGPKWYYSNSSGVMQTGWQRIGGKWYYLGSDGKMRTGWYKAGPKWYYSNGSGAMQTGWQRIGGKWYYLGSDGKMRTGWYKVGPKWYYANSSGAMQTGWQRIGGKWYWLDGSGRMIASTSKKIGKRTYRFNASGVCLNP